MEVENIRQGFGQPHWSFLPANLWIQPSFTSLWMCLFLKSYWLLCTLISMFDSYACQELTRSLATAHFYEPCRSFISGIVPRLINLWHIGHLINICILGELLFSDCKFSHSTLLHEFAENISNRAQWKREFKILWDVLYNGWNRQKKKPYASQTYSPWIQAFQIPNMSSVMLWFVSHVLTGGQCRAF